MPTSSTPDDVRREHLAKLGPDLGPVYHDLWNDVAWLHLKWGQYRELFGTSKDVVELLNDVAPFLTKVIQDALWSDTLLHLCRLTDAQKIAGRSNLVLATLSQHAPDPATRSEIDRLVEEARASTKFARDWRNRKIAHRDLELRLNSSGKPLAHASRASVEDALKRVSGVMHFVEDRLLGSTTGYEHGIGGRGAGHLIHALRRARKQGAQKPSP